ncbi:GNAT family N-acetyltransferase [Mycetocola zhujimingii]|uniref:GNAT family N-acetyltransferase n=1 Tax=Mycetocola zhujimingii TaxID=2079792 RepID=UPI000D33DEC5|nr:GNAT family protein [Mycetocola zhujimingii]AWB87254.1 N-acetyltransferase [Mycetocola zhujimingii]
MTDIPMELPLLGGPRLRLRAWRASDVPTVQEASRDQLIPSITTVPSTDGEREALDFVARQHDRLRTREGYSFVIADASDRAVGHIGMFFAAGAGARASVGYWIVASQRQQGYAAEALETLTSWARHHPDLDRLELYVEPWNRGSWRAAESAGYEREGLLRAWQRIDGTPRDMYMYAQLTARASAADATPAGTRPTSREDGVRTRG